MALELARSPTLTTVQMIEDAVKEHSGEYTRTELWKKLPRKVMWQTYLVAIDYLQHNLKIALDNHEKLSYIWNPALAKQLAKRKPIQI